MSLLKKKNLALGFLATVVILGFSGMPSVVTAQQQSFPPEVLVWADTVLSVLVLYG